MPASSSNGVASLVYETIRNLTSPEEKANGAKSYFANIPLPELLKLDTDGNLRDYIPDHPGKSRNTIHRAIGETLREKTDRFIQLSSGLTVSANNIEIDDQKKIAHLTNASVINGAQTQGEIRHYISELEKDGHDVGDFHARVEFMVDTDKEFIVESAIARNSSTNVQKISMLGKKKYFEEMDTEFQKVFPSLKLAISETSTGPEFVDTKRLLQVLWALMPEEILPKGKTSPECRLKSYKNQAFCLIDFEKDVVGMLESNAESTERWVYFKEMAGPAWELYLKWRHHPTWGTLRLHESTKAIRRSKDLPNRLVVSDGVVFPILSAMSSFVEKAPGGSWTIAIPPVFDETGMLSAARDQLTAHKGQPMSMGRDAGVYAGLLSFAKMVLNAQRMVSAAKS